MLKIVNSMKELDFSGLCFVYAERICENGRLRYPLESEGMQNLLAQQDFYSSLCLFFEDKTAALFYWDIEDCCCAALRLEKYNDGYLLNSLETAPREREKGCAKALVSETIQYLKSEAPVKLYSHIDNRNYISISVHTACGFKKILDHAVYLDGSVLHTSSTYLYEIV